MDKKINFLIAKLSETADEVAPVANETRFLPPAASTVDELDILAGHELLVSVL